MNEPRRIVAFSGPVQCRVEDAPLGLTLEGCPAEAPGARISLVFSFAARPPPRLPNALHDVMVECLQNGEPATAGVGPGACSFRVRDAQQKWEFRAAACHLHREVSSQFYRAIPPRPAPWSKRMFWRLVLALAARPVGKRLLLALRRR